ncbi:histidine ammonia-lyase [Ignavibacteria bacterium]|nr:histidine ammonia-lyase [Bacteroidota bacterium]MCZ2132741.1 histidine ammonia-lyase [Bacteroidota bacterium]
MQTLILDGNSLTIETLVKAIEIHARISLSDVARGNVRAARAVVDRWVERREIVYGVTTGFGEFANVVIPPEELELLQENLIVSHSAGAGDFLPDDIVRTMMILRVNALAKGHSGIREGTLDTLIAMLNADIIPAVPSQGSVGSSGDLAQLSHIALALIGRGTVLENGKAVPSGEAMRRAGIEPVSLKAKEGLALINGTQMMCAFGALTVAQARNLADTADIAGAFSLDALRGTDRAFDERLHRLRGFRGQSKTAENLRDLLSGSEIRKSHIEGDSRVQDAYSLRCMPQVHGASRDAIGYVWNVISTELNSANDNPLIFPDTEEHIEGGNFHGQPLALALDFLAIACAELGNISERRTERMVNGTLSGGLPRFLARRGGVESGMMIAQYTAAAIVSENKILCHPASVDSIPTSANQEDHNSMGSIAAQKAHKVVDSVETILAVELLCAAQAIEFHRPLTTSRPLEAVLQIIRSAVPKPEGDRVVYHDIQAVKQLIHSGAINRAVVL